MAEITITQALGQAVEAFKAGKIQLSNHLLAAILNAHPKHPDANHNMGLLNSSVGKVEVALPFFKAALEAQPSVAQFWVDYINTLIKVGKLNEAKAIFGKAINNGAAGDAFDKLEIRLTQSNRGPIVAQDPPTNQLQPLLNLYNQGRLKQALSTSNNLITLFPNSAILHNICGAAYTALKQYDAAIESYRQALKIMPEFADGHYNMGSAQMGKGSLDVAIKSFRKALEINPGHTEAHANMGNAFKANGDLDAAIHSFKQALKIQPNNAEVYYNMGNTFADKGSLDTAIDNFKKAINIKPNYAEAYNNIGSALSQRCNFEAAMVNFSEAIKIEPNFAEPYYNIGNILEAKGQLDAAIKNYNQAIKVKPDYAEAHNNIGISLISMENIDAALDSFQQAIKIKPEYAEAHNNMGNALKDKNDPKAAIECYQQAIKIKPEYAEAHSNMGGALENKGDFKAALQSYRQALKIEPNFSKAWYNLLFVLQALKLQISSEEELFSLIPEGNGSQYAQIRNSIMKHQLSLGSANSESSLEEAVELLSQATDINIKNSEVSKNKGNVTPILPDKIVALVHFGRSGTGLLHSLIDGHPEVATMPSIYFSEYFDHSVWETITAGGWSEIVNRFIANYEVLFDASASTPVLTKSAKLVFDRGIKEGLANVGPGQDEVLKVDKGLFRTELHRLMKSYDQLDALDFFRLVQAAYSKAINDLNRKNLIFYHIHNPDGYAQLNFTALAPHAEWIMMVREPIQSCESWMRKNFSENHYSNCSSRILGMLFEIDNIIYHKQNSIGVRLEDLKDQPKKTIPALCKWMGINEHESLFEMTAQGKKWWGDPASPDFAKEGMDPFGRTAIKRKVGSILSETDQFILSTLFYPFSVRFGYVQENAKQFEADLQKVRPMLDNMFDFEKTIAERTKVEAQAFMSTGAFLRLRAGLIDRWNVLDQHHTYPNMITPLLIH